MNYSQNRDDSSTLHVRIGVPIIPVRENKGLSCGLKVCVCTGIAAATAISVIGRIYVIATYEPIRTPGFQVESVSVSLLDNRTVSQYHLFNSTEAESIWNLVFSVSNFAEGFSIDYESFDVSVVYMANHSSESVIPSFHQDKRSTAFLNAIVTIVSPGFNDTDKEAAAMGGSVTKWDFEVKMNVRYSYDCKGGRGLRIQASCNDLTVGFSSVNASQGSLIDAPKSCTNTDDL